MREHPRTRAAQIPRLSLTIIEASAATGLHESTIRRLLTDGTIPCREVGKRKLIPVSAIVHWLNGGEPKTEAGGDALAS